MENKNGIIFIFFFQKKMFRPGFVSAARTAVAFCGSTACMADYLVKSNDKSKDKSRDNSKDLVQGDAKGDHRDEEDGKGSKHEVP